MNNNQIVDYHRKAAEHFEEAAKHHKKASELYKNNSDSEASHQAHLAHGHAVYAVQQQTEAAKAHVERHSDELGLR